MKRVSVIIPTYRGDERLLRAVDSALGQDYPDLEVIVVDDNGLGTPEQARTAALLSKYEGDARLRYIAHEVNKNGAAARNTGAKHASGDYIALLDDDDSYLPGRIVSAVQRLDALEPEWAMCYCSVVKHERGRAYLQRARKSGELLYPVLLHRVKMGSGTLLVRREAYQALGGFDESFRRHQDYEFTARVAARYKIAAVAQPGLNYYPEVARNRPNSLEQAAEYRAHYLEKMLPLIESLSPFQGQMVVCVNALDVYFKHLKQNGPAKTWRLVRAFARRFLSRPRPDAMLCAWAQRLGQYIAGKIRARFPLR